MRDCWLMEAGRVGPFTLDPIMRLRKHPRPLLKTTQVACGTVNGLFVYFRISHHTTVSEK